MSSTDDRLSDGPDLDRPVALHPLVYLDEGDEVTVGRVDIDSYAVFPSDGAELVRRLAEGLSPREAARAYRETHGETVDIADLLEALEELGFVRTSAEPVASPPPVRWQRLGRAVFSLPALTVYLAVVVLGLIETVRVPQLAPRPANLFFTSYFSIIELTLYLGQFPFLVVHEGFHALAGRRLGLPSRLSIGHRLIFVVLETSLDGLVAVDRSRRYLPILAGMLADLLIAAVLTLTADLTRLPGGGLSPGSRLCLALAYATLLRLAWQAFLYLRTDLYVLLSTVLGCHDLHGTAKSLLRNRIRRVLGRPVLDESAWHPTDRRVARWYAWLMVAGYAFTVLVFANAVVPVAYRFVTGVLDRFSGRPQLGSLLDSAVLLALIAGQLLAVAVLIGRDRRRRRHHTSTAVLG